MFSGLVEMFTHTAISVILPFYNAEKTLDRAIRSIVNQDYSNFELILVDNNSDDKSRRIARKWNSEDPRIILLREQRQGVVFATNTGASNSKGKYISRMDADDEAFPGKLRLQKNFLDSNPAFGVVSGLVEYVPHDKSMDGFSQFVEWNNSIQSYKDIMLNRFIEFPLVNPTIMWRKELESKFGLYRNGDFPEDYEMILRWLEAGVKIEKLTVKVLKWYDSESRLTRTDKRYSETAFYQIKSHYLARWLKKKNPFHPYVSVWGASRISRRRASYLEKLGIRIQTYIDTKQNRQIDTDIIYYKNLPAAGNMFLLSYIRQYKNRDLIRKFLNDKGYREGVDFLMIS